MSTVLSDAMADCPAPRALFQGLIDDAAVFPPGNAALDDAVSAHRRHRTAGYADLVGPLLLPASAAPHLSELTRDAGDDPLAIVLIHRFGADPAELLEAIETLAAVPTVRVVGTEQGWHPAWRRSAGELPAVLELPRGEDQRRAFDDIAASADECVPVRGKFRTGATPTWGWPTENELAAILHEAHRREIGMKLTGGLHHVIRADHPDPQHGLLNVLVAMDRINTGADAEQAAQVLAERDPAPLAADVATWDERRVSAVRDNFTGYGCCEVTDPIHELSALNLIEES